MVQNTPDTSNIDERPPSVTATTPHVPHLNNLMILFTAAGSTSNNRIIVNDNGEQAWHFKNHIRLVIIAIHKHPSNLVQVG